MNASKKSLRKAESRVAICCGTDPTVVIIKRGDAIANILIGSEGDIIIDSKFEEVSFIDISCSSLFDLPTVSVEVRWRRLACLIRLVIAPLSKGNGLHLSEYRRFLTGDDEIRGNER